MTKKNSHKPAHTPLTVDALEPRQMLSSVQIFAAGVEGTEIINLEIAGNVVQTFDNLGTGAYAGQYVQLDFESPDTIAADDVRINFTNDQYDPELGIDSNVRIDAIVIDGVRFETEAAEVFSTGTWLPEDGIAPGFRQSEFLNTNGYFQYAGEAVEPPTGDVSQLVINEIHYNPADALDGDAEFLELYNPTDQIIGLEGLSFTGFTLTFGAGTTIGAGEYAIVAPSTLLAEQTWGVTPIAEFEGGGLSGGGELIQLLNVDGTVIDEVDYLDEAPWTPGADGLGPSLELRDPVLDNAVPTNWGASDGDPTPAEENSIFGVAPVDPITDIVVTPGEVQPNTAFDISANIAGATTSTLYYKVGMDGAEVAVAMTNTPETDVWTATLPGADAGSLVRYRIESDVAVAPFADDTINYLGLVVSDPAIADNSLSVLQFFVNDAEFTALTTTEQALTNDKIEAVVWWNGQVIDNATVRVRGGDFSRINYDKKSLKFELPKGYTIDIGEEGEYLVDEFAIQADFGDWSQVAPDNGWDIFNEQTESFQSSFFVRAQINGQFHGVFRYQNLYDGAYRDANGFEDGDEFYKAGGGAFGDFPIFDKKTPDDGDIAKLLQLNSFLTSPASAEKTAYLYENVDIPNVINHMAISTLIRHDDQSVQNFYLWYKADEGTWSIVEWDIDRTFIVPPRGNIGPFTTPESIQNELLDAVFEVPEFQDMYWRRIQTLVDTYLSDDRIYDAHIAQIELIGAQNSADEFAKWNRNDIFANRFWADEFNIGIQQRREAFAAETRMPGTATGVSDIVINELHYNPLDGDAEFLELYNNSNESIDLSGWTIDAVDLKIPFGTVILPGEHIVFTDDFSQFKSQYGGNVFVAGQYDGGLKGSGELVELRDASGELVDSVEYDDTDPWVTSPDGDGFTLSLVDPTLDNSLAASWVASSQINGTPALANDTVLENSVLTVFAAGTTGEEILTIDVAGEQVATFTLSDFGGAAGDLTARNFVEYQWISTTPINVNDIRINFINDQNLPVDRNVAIDRIEIDGVAYETEAPAVFSTGTWLPEDGVSPGFRTSEILHANGYFQYSDGEVINVAPVAGDDSLTTDYNTAVSGNLLTNDSDDDGDTISVIANTDPSDGAVSVEADGSFVYTPNDGFSGTDSFQYTITDGNNNTAVATVSIEVAEEVLPGLFADGNILEFRNIQFSNAYLVLRGSSDAGTSTSRGALAQWQIIDRGNNTFNLQNVATGRYLDGDSGGNIDTSSSSNGTDRLWRFVEINPGQYHIVNVQYNGIVDAEGSIAPVRFDPDSNNEADDLWVPTIVQQSDVLVPGNVIQLSNVRDGGFVNASSSVALLTSANGGSSQWQLIAAGGGNQFRLRNVGNSRYLDGDAGDVDLTSFSGSFGTVWEFISLGNDQFHLRNTAYNRYLDANGLNNRVDWDVAPLESDDQWIVTVAGGPQL